jgi:hypothetical protein
MTENVMPDWDALVARPVLQEGWAWDLRVDTGEFRLWTARTGLADGEPYEHTVYVELFDEGRWVSADEWATARWCDVGHYDGDDPPRGLPGVTPHAFRGELR